MIGDLPRDCDHPMDRYFFFEKVTVLWIVTILGMVTIMLIIIKDGEHHKGLWSGMSDDFLPS